MKLRLMIVALLFWMSLVSSSHALETNVSGMNGAAEKLTKILLDSERRSVTFGQFDQDSETGGNVGPGIRSELILAFESVNKLRTDKGEPSVRVDSDVNAGSVIKGSFSTDDDPNDLGTPEPKRLLVVKINVVITDGTDKISDFTFYLERARDIITAEGLTLKLNPNHSPKQDHAAIRKAIENTKADKPEKAKPMFAADGSKIKTSPDSPFAVELVTRSPVSKVYAPRGPKKDSGVLPLVPIGVGEIYGVKIYNDSDEEVAVSLKIDGIDQFTFSEDRNPDTARPRFSSWIIGPKSDFTIKGWHTTSDPNRKDNLAAFLVTKYGEGASKYAPPETPGNVGVISVSFAKSHPADSKNAKSSAETGFGPPVEQKQKVVERKIDPPHEFISVRYNR